MTQLRWLTAGESHGPSLSVILEGVPAGLPLLEEDLAGDLRRRQQGYGRGGRMKIERDSAALTGGVRGGETLGGPIAISIRNRDFDNWQGRMGAAPFDTVPEPVLRPRPGHADLAGGLKYDRRDLRDILERASARETAARVAVGAVCRKLLEVVGTTVRGRVVQIGDVVDHSEVAEWSDIEASDVGCGDPAIAEEMRAAIKRAAHAGDTLGGVFEVQAVGVIPGLGSHVQWDRKLDGRLAQALMSIPAIKGVEIGLGFEAARRRGSAVHDPIQHDGGEFVRPSNGAGGLEGGISTGQPILCRAAMKPIATLKKALPSVNIVSKEAELAAHERSDVCAVVAARVVGEAMVCIELARALLEKFGADSVDELLRNVAGYRAQLDAFPRHVEA